MLHYYPTQRQGSWGIYTATLEAAPRSVNSMECLASMYRTGASFCDFGESIWTKDNNQNQLECTRSLETEDWGY